MSREAFDFKIQLAVGDKSEKSFISLYPEKLTKSEDRRWDFETTDGTTIELKTDTYDPDKTVNFFMERYSDIKSKKPGGPWRSAEDGVDIFIYYFPKKKVYYEFRNLKKLIKKLNELTVNDYVVAIPNKGWLTGGYKVPRDLLVKFFKRVEHK